jgi:hypothetical protein
MESWIANNWWWVWPIVVAVAYITYRVRSRGEGEPVSRGVYAVFPVLDPNGTEQRQLTPRVVGLFAIGLVIILVAVLFVPGFV